MTEQQGKRDRKPEMLLWCHLKDAWPKEKKEQNHEYLFLDHPQFFSAQLPGRPIALMLRVHTAVGQVANIRDPISDSVPEFQEPN